MTSHRCRRNAFTLIELLVVMSIIALLIGILLPALSAARGVARRAQSSSNIRSIHQGMMMFAEANNGYFPGVRSTGRIDDAPAGDGFAFTTEDGLDVGVRMAIMLDENWTSSEVLVAPGDRAVSEWHVETDDDFSVDDHFSYALLWIDDDDGDGVLNEALARNQEWRTTGNHRAIVLGDRNTGNLESPTSMWGNIFITARNDGSVDADRGHERRTQMGDRARPIAADHIFENMDDEPTGEPAYIDENVVLIEAGDDAPNGNGE